MAGMKGGRQRKGGQGFQLPSHIQTSLNKEERLLQRNLMDLEKETRHKMRCIVQDQQVASTKLRSLQSRLLASQKKFHALIHPCPPDEQDREICTSLITTSSELIQENDIGVQSRRQSLHPDHSQQQEEEGRVEEKKAAAAASSRRGSRVQYLRSSLREAGGKRRSSTVKIRQKNVAFKAPL